MTTVLPGSESVSMVERGVYEVNESGTTLPYFAEQILEGLGYRHLWSTGIDANTRTVIEQSENDLQSGGYGLRFWTRQELGLVRLQVMRPAFPGYEAAATHSVPGSRGSTSPSRSGN